LSMWCPHHMTPEHDRSGDQSVARLHAVPADLRVAAVGRVDAVGVVHRPQHGRLAQFDHVADELQQFGVGVRERPVEPGKVRCPGSTRCCCRAVSAPTSSPTTPSDAAAGQQQEQRVLDLLDAQRSISGSSSDPSAPQFQLCCRWRPSCCSRRWPRCACRCIENTSDQREAVVTG